MKDRLVARTAIKWLPMFLIAGGAAFVTLFGQPSPGTADKSREYKVVEVQAETRSMEHILNAHAVAGWELTAVAMGDLQRPRLILTRQE